MAWCYFGSAELITWYHFYIINAQLLEVFVHIKAKRGWKLFEIREIRESPSKNIQEIAWRFRKKVVYLQA